MKKIGKNAKLYLIGMIIGGITLGLTTVVADTIINSTNVSYKTSTVKAALDDLYGLTADDVWQKIYPIGIIYLSVNSTSPATLFGGTWTQISNRFLYCTTSGATGTGGASSVPYTPAGTVGGHTLTVSEIPSHCHGQKTIGNDGNINPWVGPNSGSSQGVYTRQQSAWYNSGHQNVETYNTGGGGSHNHGFTGTQATISTMPPYMKVYAWYRTA